MVPMMASRLHPLKRSLRPLKEIFEYEKKNPFSHNFHTLVALFLAFEDVPEKGFKGSFMIGKY